MKVEAQWLNFENTKTAEPFPKEVKAIDNVFWMNVGLKAGIVGISAGMDEQGLIIHSQGVPIQVIQR